MLVLLMVQCYIYKDGMVFNSYTYDNNFHEQVSVRLNFGGGGTNELRTVNYLKSGIRIFNSTNSKARQFWSSPVLKICLPNSLITIFFSSFSAFQVDINLNEFLSSLCFPSNVTKRNNNISVDRCSNYMELCSFYTGNPSACSVRDLPIEFRRIKVRDPDMKCRKTGHLKF